MTKIGKDLAEVTKQVDGMLAQGLEWKRRAEAAEALIAAQRLAFSDYIENSNHDLEEVGLKLVQMSNDKIDTQRKLNEARAEVEEQKRAADGFERLMRIVSDQRDDRERMLEKMRAEVERLREALLLCIPEPRRCRRNEHTGQCMTHADERECQATKALEVRRSGIPVDGSRHEAEVSQQSGPATTNEEPKP